MSYHISPVASPVPSARKEVDNRRRRGWGWKKEEDEEEEQEEDCTKLSS
jgi:hypothetical protein